MLVEGPRNTPTTFGEPLQRYCLVDYETRSKENLKVAGAYAYARHESTRVLCVAWRIGTKAELRQAPIKCWSPYLPQESDDPSELIEALADPNIIKVAHNAFFEQCISILVLPRHFKNAIKFLFSPKVWRCTAARAAAKALPRALEAVCLVLKLPFQKNMEGHKAMLKLSKPRKPTKNNPSIWNNSIDELRKTMGYCRDDIAAETEVFLDLPPLSRQEQAVWELDQKINWNGFEADRDLVSKVLRMIGEEKGKLDCEIKRITKGAINSGTERDRVLKAVRGLGVDLPNLQSKTLADIVSAGNITGPAARLISIRQSVSKTSTAKYKIFECRSRHDSRVRDTIMYHAAHTGRFGGKGLQPHNFPKPAKYINDTWLLADVCKEGDLELVRMLYGDPMTAFSTVLRSVIQAPTGREFFCGDFAGIEARVVFWLANQQDALTGFRENRDLYVEMASVIFNVPQDKVTAAQRDIGKRVILGCGFGMGWKKFKITCWEQGNLIIEDDLAKRAVTAYRSEYRGVTSLWSNLERAAIAAVVNPDRRYKINNLSWYMEDRWLICELPSGRKLSYFGPKIKHTPTPWGESKPTLYYWAVNSKTKKWEFNKTYGGHLTENAVQATARDLMVSAMLRADAGGVYDVVLSVHDELLAEADFGKGSVLAFEKLMSDAPTWAEGLPVRVAAWKGPRYRK